MSCVGAHEVLEAIENDEIEIDEEIKDIIIRLNQLGYMTLQCCAGHGPEDNHPSIQFCCRPDQMLDFADRLPHPLMVKNLEQYKGAWFIEYYPGHVGVTWTLTWRGVPDRSEPPKWDVVREVLDSFQKSS